MKNHKGPTTFTATEAMIMRQSVSLKDGIVLSEKILNELTKNIEPYRTFWGEDFGTTAIAKLQKQRRAASLKQWLTFHRKRTP